MPNLSERLRELRAKHNVTQAKLSDNCDIALRSLRYYESGERIPDGNTIIKLCTYFNVSADYLLGLSDNPERR